MKARSILPVAIILLLTAASFAQQRAEVTISLNEPFFDALVDAIFQNSPPPEFPLSKAEPPRALSTMSNSFAEHYEAACGSVTLLRENRSVKTAVRLREGKITAPVAFNGTYSPPLIGCVDFSGSADTTVELQFDKNSQKLYGRIKVNSVNLDGTGGLGGSIIARMVQGSIDKKLNPIEIIDLNKLSFPFTLPNSAKLKMKAVGLRHEVVPGAVNIVISYEFAKD
jgi:hypothetical protein